MKFVLMRVQVGVFAVRWDKNHIMFLKILSETSYHNKNLPMQYTKINFSSKIYLIEKKKKNKKK